MPKRGSSERYALDEEQINRLWRACKKLPDKVLVGLLMFEGLRVGEAVHLNSLWIKSGSIWIPPSMPCTCWSCSDTGLWKPKSRVGARTIPIVEILEEPLSTFLRYQPGGLGYSRIMAWKRVKELTEEASIAYSSPHALRATYATILAKNNFSAPAICYLLGWASITMGQHYINIAQAKAEAQKVRGLFSSGGAARLWLH